MLDCGIPERDFWEMTLAEITRVVSSYKRVKEVEAKERASFDYILGDLIGRSTARLISKEAEYPHISEVYPSLFQSQDLLEERNKAEAELQSARFRQFVDTFNKRFNKTEVATNTNE